MEKDPKETWREVLSQIQLTISKTHFRTWFSSSQLVAISGNTVTLNVKNKIAKNYLENDFLEIIQTSFKKILGTEVELKININKDINIKDETLPLFKDDNSIEKLEKETVNNHYDEAISALGINRKYIFENFIVGSSNRLAHAAAYAVAENPGTTYNPLFIYGNVGLGKTHLIQAIANFILKKNPSFKIVYSSSEVFLNEMISSIRSGHAENFRKKYREKDLLIIDDIQFIESKKGTQEEIFHTFNSMYQYNKQIIIVSDRPPEEMPFLEARLRSRFEGGMVVDINEPDFETRLAILQKKCEEKEYKLNNEVLNFIANRFTSNVRELEGILTKIGSLSIIGKEIQTEKDAMKFLGDKFAKNKLRIKPSDILDAVCDNFSINIKEIKGIRRTEKIAFARQVAMYILRIELQLAHMEIAKILNRKDHTTVMYAVDKIDTLMHKDDDIKFEVETIIKNLRH